MPNKLWFHKWKKFSALSASDKQAFLVSEVVDQFIPSKIDNYSQKYGIEVPNKSERGVFIEVTFSYCASLCGASNSWEDEYISFKEVSLGPIKRKDVAYHMFKKYPKLVHGFSFRPSGQFRSKASYECGLIAYLSKYLESHFDDLGRYMAETDFAGKILDEVLADATDKLGRVIYAHDVENRLRTWGVF